MVASAGANLKFSRLISICRLLTGDAGGAYMYFLQVFEDEPPDVATRRGVVLESPLPVQAADLELQRTSGAAERLVLVCGVYEVFGRCSRRRQ